MISAEIMMQMIKINMAMVAMPFPYTGGTYRALLSLKEYKKRDINPYLVLPWTFNFNPPEKMEKDVRFLIRNRISIHGNVLLPRIFLYRLPLRKSVIQMLTTLNLLRTKIVIRSERNFKFHCVMSMHESLDSIATAFKIGETFSLKRIVLLQLPPFYKDEERRKRIKEAENLWFKIVYPDPLLREPWKVLLEKIERNGQKTIKKLLNKFDLIIAVSRAIPLEMGEEWFNKVISLDPGVALSNEDARLINKILRRTKEKDRIVISGTASPKKGLIEGLIVWRHILKSINQDYKLVVTGNIQPNILNRLNAFCQELGIEDKVLFTGFVSREKRLSLIAKSKLMIYPSHVDAFPYTVLEALNLKTPVVAYDIPALRIYYNNLEGVTLVKESDIEALAQKSVEAIENRHVNVETPKIVKTWDNIMDEETSLIKKFVVRYVP
jgi:glycosyltransferase involved in cell wall biosynthesis